MLISNAGILVLTAKFLVLIFAIEFIMFLAFLGKLFHYTLGSYEANKVF